MRDRSSASLVSKPPRGGAAPYAVLALYVAAEVAVAIGVIGRVELLLTAVPIVALAAVALARRGAGR